MADSDGLLDLSRGIDSCAVSGCPAEPVATGTLPFDGQDRPAGLCEPHHARLGRFLANRTVPVPDTSLANE